MMTAGVVSLPVRVACGDKLIMDTEIQVPVIATVHQDDTGGVQVQVSADMPGCRKALAGFLYRAAEEIGDAEFDNPVDCHSTHSKPTPTSLERMFDSVTKAVRQQ